MRSRKLGRYLPPSSLTLTFVVLVSVPVVAREPDAKALRFSERVVAGGPDDFMTVRHLKLGGSQRAIGKKLAEIARSRHDVKLPRPDPAVAKSRAEFYNSAYREHYERALGVADYFGVPLDGGPDPTALPYNLLPILGCSVVYYPPSHVASRHAMLSRNYDWSTGTWADLAGPSAGQNTRRTTEDPYVIEVYPDRGYASLYICAYELLGGCFDGVNSKGLSMALLANSHGTNPTPTLAWRPGLSEMEIGRYVLETCANVEEARKALQSVEFYYAIVPCHYIIGDRDGNSFVWEYSANLERRYFTFGKGGPQWVTNHAIHERAYPTVESIPPTVTGSTFDRFRRLSEEINRAPVKRSPDHMKEANRCVRAPGWGTPPVRTLWHALYDCHDSSLEVDFYLGLDGASGEERRSGYVRFKLGD